jgi:hypothetical protein
MITLKRWWEPTTWRTYKEITLSSSDHKDETTIGPVLSDMKKISISRFTKSHKVNKYSVER